MKTLETIKSLTREELEAYRNEVLAELHLDIHNLPFSVFAALKSSEGVPTISNSMFYVVLHNVTDHWYYLFGTTEQWLEDDNIKAWIKCSSGADNYIFFLTNEQKELMERIVALSHTISSNNDLLREVSALVDNALETTGLTEAERSHPLVMEYQIPENSGSLNIAEYTSRFSGALWFEQIQKKFIILAGLGGIGSYVGFLLARMQPTAIFLYDDDVVESANMSGQLYGYSDIGTFKVDAMASMMANYANYGSVFALRERYTAQKEAADIMICGFDNMEARKTFFRNWITHVLDKPSEERKHCLFIDGRLSAEYLQVYCLTGDNDEAIAEYSQNALFSDDEADETVCSYKQTTYMANMIGSLIVNIFTNFVANEVAGALIRELPYFTSYDGNSMQLKIE